MLYIELQQHINKILDGDIKIAPVYVLQGDDEYLISQAIKTFENVIEPDFASFNVSKFLKDADMVDVINSLNTFPVFTDLKLVLLEGKNYTEEEKAQLLEYFNAPNEQAIFVVYYFPDANKKSDDYAKRSIGSDVFAKMKIKNLETVNCSVLDENSVQNEIVRLCHIDPKIEIERDAILELSTRTQRRMARIVGEIAKLKSYSDGIITKKDVCDLVQEDLDFKGYEFADAVSKKDNTKALEILNVFLKAGYTTDTIIYILYDKYRKMLHVELNKNMDNEEVGKYFGMSKGAVYYLRQVSSNYSQVRLKNSVDYLHKIQTDLRNGVYADEAALHNVVIGMLNM